MRAEAVTAVNHDDRFCDGVQVHRPVERRVTTTDDQDALPRERARVQDAIVQSFVVPTIHVLERQLARREGADPAGDQYRTARILVLVGDDREERLAVVLTPPQPDDFLGEMDRGLPLQALFRERLHGIERGQLATDLIEVVDQSV